MNKSLASFKKTPFYQGFLTGIVTIINLCKNMKSIKLQHKSWLQWMFVYIRRCKSILILFKYFD